MDSQQQQAMLLIAAQVRLERKYRPLIFQVKMRAWENTQNMDAATQKIQSEFVAVFSEIYTDAAIASGRAMLTGLKSADRYETKRSPEFWLNVAQRWLFEWGLGQAGEVTETTIKDAQKALADSVAEGLGEAAAAKALRDYAKISRERSRTIARTEVHNAAMYAAQETARDYAAQTGLKIYKEWDPTMDSRTRPDHAEMAFAKARPMDEDFNVGGYPMSRPGDPRGGAGNVINCRCVLTITDNFDELF